MTPEDIIKEAQAKADITYGLFMANHIVFGGEIYCHIASVQAGINHINQSLSVINDKLPE